MTSELVRSTSEEMKPAISRATSLLPSTLFASISADAFIGAERVAQLVRQPRRELAQRGQTLGPAHGGFGFLQAEVGFRQLFGGGFGFAGGRSRLLPPTHALR